MREFYHVFNRGVEKRDIFVQEEDYLRFIHDLYEFNDQNQVLNLKFRFNYGSQTSIVRKRLLIVNIHCFCLMPNHFHLILEPLVDNGISLFMQKMGSGYTNYFNNKYQRVGPLFQGRFKRIKVEKDEYLLHLSRYQHLNPIELIVPNWSKEGLGNWQKVNEFLKTYRWTSYLDYIGIKNFPSVINREFISGYFQTPNEYEKYVSEFIPETLIKIKNLITMEVRLP